MFKKILNSDNFARYFEAFIRSEASFRTSEMEFRYVCENKYPLQTISILLNYGEVEHSQEERIDWQEYTGRLAKHWVFSSKNAGYIPTQGDLEFAEKQGCDQGILELIKNNLKRVKYGFYIDQFGQKLGYQIQNK